MNKLILAFIVAFSTVSAQGQTFKVKKVKGNQAVIVLPRGITLNKGARYNIENSDDELSVPTVGSGGRERTIGFTTSYFTGSTSASAGTSVSQTSFEIDGRYGWNAGVMEYGPLAGLDYDSSGSISSRTLTFGAFFDYNLVPNDPGAKMVYGVGAVAGLALTSVDTGGGSDSGSAFDLRGGGQVKWFPFGHSTCVRGDAQLRFVKASETTTTGLYFAAGLQTYF
jgi:hypothetical protein